MATYSPGPRLRKGAIIGVDRFNPLASVVVFQYNPSTLTRSLDPRSAGEGGAPSEALRLQGAAVETIDAELYIDAVDQLENADSKALAMGVHPQLAALEMLLYPKSALVVANTVLAALGTIEVVPPEAPLTFFIWGPRRVVPVRINSLSVTEEMHDVDLNPIRARVNVGMRVLTYDDLPIGSIGHAGFIVNQVLRETMATLASVDNISSVASGDVRVI